MSGKGNLALGDFTIAAKTKGGVEEAIADETSSRPDETTEIGAPGEISDDIEPVLSRRSPPEREKRARDRAVAQEDARYSLKNLKRAKQREIKFFVNVALDQATKARLKRAADENDLKMATVMKAAIDFYLKENGY